MLEDHCDNFLVQEDSLSIIHLKAKAVGVSGNIYFYGYANIDMGERIDFPPDNTKTYTMAEFSVGLLERSM